MLSVPTPFLRGQRGDKRAEKAHRQFQHPTGDHLTLWQVFNAYMDNGRDKQWCWDNYLNERSLAQAVSIRKQLTGIAKRLGLENERESTDTAQDLRCAVLE